MAVTHKVVWGDTLWDLARTYGTTVDNLVKLNNIANPDLIYVGQVLYISGAPSPAKTSTTSNKATVHAIGLQANSENTIFAAWNWDKSNTAEYTVRWYYGTGDGIAFIGSEETVKFKHSTYSPPSNAYVVKFYVKPVSTTHKVNDVDTHYWTADWSTEVAYYLADNPPTKPPVPTVTVTDYKLTARVENLDVNGKAIEFQVVRNDQSVYKTGQATIQTASASYSCDISVGQRYKVRCRAVRDGLYSDWSDYSSNFETKPDVPTGISECRAASDTSVFLKWPASLNTTSYKIEYAIKEEYLGTSNSSTTLDNITSTQYTITGLSSGEKYYFRICAVNDKGQSGWCKVSSVVLGKEPAAPTTWSTTTTAMVGEMVFIYWVHNAEDASRQEYAEISLSVGGVAQVITVRNNNTEENAISQYVINTSQYAEGTNIKWKVRTCGITRVYGDWSIERNIDVYAPATLELSIQNIFGQNIENTIRTFPFIVSAVSGPSSQHAIGYHLSIVADSAYSTLDDLGNIKMIVAGDEVYSQYHDVASNLSLTMTAGDVDLENNVEYILNCEVLMDSGIKATDSLRFKVAWDGDMELPNAEINIDSETMTAHIRPYCETYPTIYYKVNKDSTTGRYIRSGTTLSPLEGVSVREAFTEEYDDIVYEGTTASGTEVLFCMVVSEEGELVEGVTLAVYRREFDGSFVEIGSGLANTDNTFVTDPHPALDYARYRVVATSDTTGLISYSDIPGFAVGEKSIIIQWDEQWSDFDYVGDDITQERPWSGSMLKLPYNIDVTDKNTSDVTLVKYIGRTKPVSYYGTQNELKSTWKVDIDKKDKNTIYALRRLAAWMGDVYVREPSGTGYWANITVSMSQVHRNLVIPVTLEVTRVEGGM